MIALSSWKHLMISALLRTLELSVRSDRLDDENLTYTLSSSSSAAAAASFYRVAQLK